MNIKYQDDIQDRFVVSLTGEMDAQGCSEIRPALERLLTDAAGRDVSLDIHGVSFLDSSGIGAIVFLFKRLKANGSTLSLCEVQGQPRELIELLRIDTAIPVGFAVPQNATGGLERCAS